MKNQKDGAFTALPGFKKYEFDGKIVRNVKTKAIISLQKNTGKYQLEDNSGKRVTLSADQVKKLVPIEVKVSKAAVKSAVKKGIKAGAKEVTKAPKKVSLMEQSYRMHLDGKEKPAISKALGIPQASVNWNIWAYTSGRKELKK